jgi:hypothetical protein
LMMTIRCGVKFSEERRCYERRYTGGELDIRIAYELDCIYVAKKSRLKYCELRSMLPANGPTSKYCRVCQVMTNFYSSLLSRTPLVCFSIFFVMSEGHDSSIVSSSNLLVGKLHLLQRLNDSTTGCYSLISSLSNRRFGGTTILTNMVPGIQ